VGCGEEEAGRNSLARIAKIAKGGKMEKKFFF
jgi:hypothetical protein